MTDNNYKPKSDKKVRKIPGMITGKNKMWVDLRTHLSAFVKKICELYFCKGLFGKKKPFCFYSKED